MDPALDLAHKRGVVHAGENCKNSSKEFDSISQLLYCYRRFGEVFSAGWTDYTITLEACWVSTRLRWIA